MQKPWNLQFPLSFLLCASCVPFASYLSSTGRWLFECAAVGEFCSLILAAAGPVFHGVSIDGDFIAGLDRVCFPALSGNLPDGTHLERPFSRFARRWIDDIDVKPAVRVREFKF